MEELRITEISALPFVKKQIFKDTRSFNLRSACEP